MSLDPDELILEANEIDLVIKPCRRLGDLFIRVRLYTNQIISSARVSNLEEEKK